MFCMCMMSSRSPRCRRVRYTLYSSAAHVRSRPSGYISRSRYVQSATGVRASAGREPAGRLSRDSAWQRCSRPSSGASPPAQDTAPSCASGRPRASLSRTPCDTRRWLPLSCPACRRDVRSGCSIEICRGPTRRGGSAPSSVGSTPKPSRDGCSARRLSRYWRS